MPKMKTNSAAKKRFKKVGNGKLVKRAKSMRRHILTKKNRKTKRNLRGVAYISKVDTANILRLLPY